MNSDSNCSPMHPAGLRFRASQLIGCKITNSREESLGDVQDIVLASDNRSIAYAVVAFGGFLGMGEKYFAIPWRMIGVSRSTADTKPRIDLSVDQELLKAAPGFDKDKWPDMADMTWSRQVEHFYSNHGGTTDGARTSNKSRTPLAGNVNRTNSGQNPDGDSFHHRRVSQLIGMNVVDANRETLAKVDDLVLDAERAKIDGAALSFGGVIGMGKHIALVPMESLTLERLRGTFSMPCTAAELEAMALPGGEWPALDSEEWLTRGRHQCDWVKSGSNQASTASWEA